MDGDVYPRACALDQSTHSETFYAFTHLHAFVHVIDEMQFPHTDVHSHVCQDGLSGLHPQAIFPPGTARAICTVGPLENGGIT